jgi:3-phenylpropionate/trans-cinnamate dioxygenase ferredoxin subunit
MADWVTVATADELEPGRVKVAEAGPHRIALCNVNGEFYAIDDVCTHDGGPLDQGELIGNQIECPRHGARFDVRTGRVTALPAVYPVKTYQVRQQEGQVQVLVE